MTPTIPDDTGDYDMEVLAVQDFTVDLQARN